MFKRLTLFLLMLAFVEHAFARGRYHYRHHNHSHKEPAQVSAEDTKVGGQSGGKNRDEKTSVEPMKKDVGITCNYEQASGERIALTARVDIDRVDGCPVRLFQTMDASTGLLFDLGGYTEKSCLYVDVLMGDSKRKAVTCLRTEFP